jgi:hypothetical protein
MTTKTTSPSLDKQPPAKPWQPPCLTTEERLQQIGVLGQRINGYVRFICEVGLNGTSAEAKEQAVAAFYERIVVLERQLGHIQENLQLG